MLDTTPTPDRTLDGAAPAMPTMDGLLSDLARRNPDLAWMTQMIAAQRQAAVQRLPEEDPRDAQIAELNEQLEQAQARFARLRRIARRLSGELETTRGFLADLAAAFGACGLCWGEDTRCPSCRGRGKPGRFDPDPELRLRFCVPHVEPPDASPTATSLDQSNRR